MHGYDNNDDNMKSLMLGRGPNLNCGYRQGSMRAVDLYPLLCRLMSLQTCHTNAGDISITTDMVTESHSCVVSSGATVPDYSAIIPTLGLILYVLFY